MGVLLKAAGSDGEKKEKVRGRAFCRGAASFNKCMQGPNLRSTKCASLRSVYHILLHSGWASDAGVSQ